MKYLSTILFLLPFSNIYAQEEASEGSPFSPFIGLILMVAVFFFLIILPQSRRAKKQAQFLSSLQKGDDVVTQSGLYGKIYGITERVVTLEIAPQVKVRVDRQSIAAKDTTSQGTSAKAVNS